MGEPRVRLRYLFPLTFSFFLLFLNLGKEKMGKSTMKEKDTRAIANFPFSSHFPAAGSCESGKWKGKR